MLDEIDLVDPVIDEKGFVDTEDVGSCSVDPKNVAVCLVVAVVTELVDITFRHAFLI